MRKNIRIGFGYDVHPLKKGKNLILCGVKICSEKGLEGHSDADVVIHALMDALLGASGQGDIGMHFSNKKAKWKDISSMILLEKVVKIIERENYKINNIDITIVLEKPTIVNYFSEMKNNISKILKVNDGKINIKATTNEGIGFIGKGDGIATFCVAAIEGKDK